MSSRRSLVRVGTKKVVTAVAPSGKIDTQYPRDWFRSNNGKPKLFISLSSVDLASSRNKIKRMIDSNTVTITEATTFLYHFAKTVTHTTDKEWVSYGVRIAEENESITPLNLLDTNEVTLIKEAPSSSTDPALDPVLALYLLGAYRILRAQVTEYRNIIVKKISEQMQAIATNEIQISDAITIYQGWMNDKNFNKLVASYDMYFNKFNDHKYSCMRVATLGSRYRDCSALLSYGYLMDFLGLKNLTDIMDWIFVPQIGDDIERIMKDGEENTDVYSYFPYQVDFGLVQKSSYSATSNPHFFEWVHLVGAMLKSQRSMNARHINESQSLNILLNAGCMAYALSHTFELTKVFTETGEWEDNVSEEEEGETALKLDPDETMKELMKSRSPSDWIKLLKSTDFQMPDPIRQFIKSVARTSTEAREGTIEHHLKIMAGSL